MPGDPRIRASDADRDRVAALLREHHAAGRLTAEEFHERMGLSLKDSPPGFDPSSAVGAYSDDDESYVETEQY